MSKSTKTELEAPITIEVVKEKRVNTRVASERLSKFSTFDNLIGNEVPKLLANVKEYRASGDFKAALVTLRNLVNVAKNLETKNERDIEAANVPFGTIQPDQVIVTRSGKLETRWMKAKQAVKADANVWHPVAAMVSEIDTIMIGAGDPINSTQLQAIVGKSKYTVENKGATMTVAYPRVR